MPKMLLVCLVAIVFMGCASAKSSPPQPGSKPTPRITILATVAPAPVTSPVASAVASPVPSVAPSVAPTATPSPLATSGAPVAFYGLQTNRTHAFNPTAMEYSEQVFTYYKVGIDMTAFRAGLAVSPATPIYATYPFVNQGGLAVRLPLVPSGSVSISLRYVPGVTYHVTQPAFGIDLMLTTPALTQAQLPAPVRAVAASPYYYGFLNHPFAGDGFLGGFVYDSFPVKTAVEQAEVDQAYKTLDEIKQSGAGYVRMDFCADQTIGHLAPYTTPDWKNYDAILGKLIPAGITVLPIIQQHCGPSYMHYDPAGGGNQTIDNPTDYATWATAVSQYLVKWPTVTRVEFFNEPNLHGGWYPGTPAYVATDGTGAAPFMQAGYSAVKAANPNLMVVAGALAAGGAHVIVKTWMNGAYVGGCKVGVCWDELSIHNYRWAEPSSATIANDPSEDNRFDVYKDAQNVAVAHGDPKPKVMLTEFGFSSCDSLTVCFDPMVQALYTANGFNLALADPTVDGVTYVNIYNSSADGPDYFWSHTALMNNDNTPKPGYAMFQQFATGSH